MSQVATIERLQIATPLRPLPERPAADASAMIAEPGLSAEHQAAPVGGELPSIAGRDFASALDLIREASDAVRLSEERANDLEHQLGQVSARAVEQIRALEAQVAATERRMQKAEERARLAESRAASAETWLIRLHDAITSSFRPSAAPEPGA